MTESHAGLILSAVADLRSDLVARDEALEARLGLRLDRMEATATDEHKDTLTEVTLVAGRVARLEKAGAEARAQADMVVRLARCAAGLVTLLAAIVGVLATIDVL